MLRVPEHIVFRKIDDTIVALNINSGQYFTLNEVGSIVWTMLDEDRSQEHIIGNIVSEFDVSQEIFEQDLALLLEELQLNGLVEVTTDEPA